MNDKGCLEKSIFDDNTSSEDVRLSDSLKNGYKELSRVNLLLAEEAVLCDNQACELCEQILAECE